LLSPCKRAFFLNMKSELLFNLFEECSGVCTDTRDILLGCLFICLKGPRYDANDFAIQALELGARYVIVDRDDIPETTSIFKVENGLHFLQDLARFHRRKHRIPIIGITGSNGKTTTKELVTTVLSKKFNVLSTVGNLNNHIGVPLTLLRLQASHQIAVIEMGANRLHDIEELCRIAEPTHGIITNIGKAHLEGFGSFEGVLRTKKELYDAVHSSNGILFVNADDSVLASNIPAQSHVYAYGNMGSSADVTGQIIRLNPNIQFRWCSTEFDSEEIGTHLIGEYNFYNILAALAIGNYFQVPPEVMNEAISNYVPNNQRSQVMKTSRNTLLLDCYNANPTSMLSALKSFLQIDHPQKLAILGDMLELGAISEEEHRGVLEWTSEHDIPVVVVGNEFSKVVTQNNCLESFSTVANMIQESSYLKTTNHLILLKGSRGIKLEQLVPYL
jgi:UDP-N-acetylmuramoyl-tripeptide--D-alanyl-D-alanine ligase